MNEHLCWFHRPWESVKTAKEAMLKLARTQG